MSFSSDTVCESGSCATAASAIQRTLTRLHLQVNRGFTDEAGVAGKALTVNKTRVVWLTTTIMGTKQLWRPRLRGIWCAMLRVNTSLVLNFPQFQPAGTTKGFAIDQMRIEQH
jgi:hypothetical protein